MEHAHTIKQFKEIYKYHKENPNDKQFENEYSREIALYKVAATELLKTYKKLPGTKEILTELDDLQEKKNTLMKEYSESKNNMDDLFIIRKNFEQYMGKDSAAVSLFLFRQFHFLKYNFTAEMSQWINLSTLLA